MALAVMKEPEAALARWARRTDGPLLALAVLFVIVISLPVLWVDMPPSVDRVVNAVDLVIWAVFAVDFAVRLGLARRRPAYIRGHLLDFVAVLLPALRPLRVLRLLGVGQMLARRGAQIQLEQLGLATGAATSLLVYLAAIVTLDAERHAEGANITSFGDAVWWACTTVTTVGYGDRFPVTATGRVVAVALMVVGIALLGVLTAGVAAWFIGRFQTSDVVDPALVELQRKVDQLLDAQTKREV